MTLKNVGVLSVAVIDKHRVQKNEDSKLGSSRLVAPQDEQLSDEDSQALIDAIMSPPAPTAAATEAAKKFRQRYL